MERSLHTSDVASLYFFPPGGAGVKLMKLAVSLDEPNKHHPFVLSGV